MFLGDLQYSNQLDCISPDGCSCSSFVVMICLCFFMFVVEFCICRFEDGREINC